MERVKLVQETGGVFFEIHDDEEQIHYRSCFLTHEEAELLGRELFNEYGKIDWT